MAPSRARGSTRRSVSGAGFFRAGWSGGWLKGDLVAEGFEPGDEAAGEEVGAEFMVGGAARQHVPDDDQERVGDHDDRLLLRGGAAVATPFHDVPVVEGLEVAVVANRGPGGFHQDSLQVGV